MNVTFPTLMRTMHVSLATVQWLTTAYLLLVTITMSTTAFILKRFSFRRLFFFAASMSLIGTIAAMLAPTFSLLLLGRMLQAIATGIATPLMFQLVFTRIPRQRIGVWTGFASVIVSLAPALGPTYGGVLTSLWSWRAIFIGVLPLLVIAAALGAANIQGPALGTKTKFDFIGLVLLALTFTSLVLTFNLAIIHGWQSLAFGIGGGVTLVLAASLMGYSQRSQRHLFDYRILRNLILQQRLGQYFGLQLINIGLSFVLPLYVQNVLHATPMTAGLMLLPGALLGAGIAPIAGKVYDHRGANLPLITSASLVTAALVLFAWFTTQFTVALIALLYALLRLGFNSGFGTAVSDASMQVNSRQKADQNSLFSMMQQFAGSVGTSLMSAVIATKALHQPAAAATLAGARIDFCLLLAVALLILGTAIAVARLTKQPV